MTLRSRVNRFLESRFDKLKAPPSRTRKTILNDSDRAVVKKIIEENSQVTIKF
jgi:hypothetical protein